MDTANGISNSLRYDLPPAVSIPGPPTPGEPWVESVSRIVRFFAPDQTITVTLPELPPEPTSNEVWAQTLSRVGRWVFHRIPVESRVPPNIGDEMNNNSVLPSVARNIGPPRPRRRFSPRSRRRYSPPPRQADPFAEDDDIDDDPIALPPGLDFSDFPPAPVLGTPDSYPSLYYPAYETAESSQDREAWRQALREARERVQQREEAIREARERVQQRHEALGARVYDTVPPRDTYVPYPPMEDEEEEAPEGFGPRYYRD